MRKREAPGKLTRSKITKVARRLINENGAPKFNMRGLARALDVDPMAVYHHFENKAELMGAVVDAMFADFEVPAETGDWRRDISAFLGQLKVLARKNPGGFLFYEGFREWSHGEYMVVEALYDLLERSAFSDDVIVRVNRVLWTYAEVFAVDEIAGWHKGYDAAELLENLPDGDFPRITKLASKIIEYRSDEEFEFGLEVLLDGLQSRRG